MPNGLRCPRCLRDAQPPGLRSSRYTCAQHGEVAPLNPALPGGSAGAVAARAQVPVWLPWPLPTPWLVTGVQAAGDDHTGWLGVVLAITGPNPLATSDRTTPRAADVLLVAEQPAVGLAARLAGLDDVDPGPALVDAMSASGPHAVVQAAGHSIPLWTVPTDDSRAVYVGEAASVWLWLIALPSEAGAIAVEELRLIDLRDPGHVVDLPVGAPSPYLT